MLLADLGATVIKAGSQPVAGVLSPPAQAGCERAGPKERGSGASLTVELTRQPFH